MVAQKGKDLLLKVDNTGAGAFVTVAGLRTHTLSFNADVVDITNVESQGAWRELLAGAGVKRASISGSGIFKDDQSDETVRGYFFNSTIRDWQIVIPDFGTVEGAFQIANLEFTGQHNGELSYELALESAGLLNFTAL
jgi:TP901-1 family phage major tail protein